MKIRLNDNGNIAIKTSDLDVFKNFGKDNKYFKVELTNYAGDITLSGSLEPCYGLKLKDGDQLSFIFWPDNPQESDASFTPFDIHMTTGWEENTSPISIDAWGTDPSVVWNIGLYTENGNYYLEQESFRKAIQDPDNAIYRVIDNNGDKFLIKIEHKDLTGGLPPTDTIKVSIMQMLEAIPGEDLNTESYISNRKTFEVSQGTTRLNFAPSSENGNLRTCYILNEITPLLPTEAKSGDDLEVIKNAIADHETRISALESAPVSKDEEADLSYLFKEDSDSYTIEETE